MKVRVLVDRTEGAMIWTLLEHVISILPVIVKVELAVPNIIN